MPKRHVVEYDELNGFEVTSQLASHGKKSLSIIATVGDTPMVQYRVIDLANDFIGTFKYYAVALETYNNI